MLNHLFIVAQWICSWPVWPLRTRRILLNLLGLNISRSSRVASGVFFGGSRVTIDEGCFINVGCFLDGSGDIRIGEQVRIGPHVRFLTGSHVYRNSVYRRSSSDKTVGENIIIARGCWIGIGVTVMPGVTIREGCIIAAGAVVLGDTEPNGLYAGVPARRVRELSTAEDESGGSACDKPRNSAVSLGSRAITRSLQGKSSQQIASEG